MVYQKKKTLYLINEGLSCLTIFKILLKILKKNRELVNKYKSDIIKFKKDKINQLSLNGILELRNTRINPKISTLLKKSNIKCFSLLSRPCIESGIICLGLFPKSELIISPLKVNNQENASFGNLESGETTCYISFESLKQYPLQCKFILSDEEFIIENPTYHERLDDLTA